MRVGSGAGGVVCGCGDGLCGVLKNHYMGFCWWGWRWLLVRGETESVLSERSTYPGMWSTYPVMGSTIPGMWSTFVGQRVNETSMGKGKCLGIRWEGVCLSVMGALQRYSVTVKFIATQVSSVLSPQLKNNAIIPLFLEAK